MMQMVDPGGSVGRLSMSVGVKRVVSGERCAAYGAVLCVIVCCEDNGQIEI